MRGVNIDMNTRVEALSHQLPVGACLLHSMGIKTTENVTSMCTKVAVSVVLLLQKKENLYLEFIFIFVSTFI